MGNRPVFDLFAGFDVPPRRPRRVPHPPFGAFSAKEGRLRQSNHRILTEQHAQISPFLFQLPWVGSRASRVTRRPSSEGPLKPLGWGSLQIDINPPASFVGPWRPFRDFSEGGEIRDKPRPCNKQVMSYHTPPSKTRVEQQRPTTSSASTKRNCSKFRPQQVSRGAAFAVLRLVADRLYH